MSKKSEKNQSLILLGAIGDLVLRKIMPSLYQLERAHLIDTSLTLYCVVRQPINTKQLKEIIKSALLNYLPEGDFTEEVWQIISQKIHCIQLDLANLTAYQKLANLPNIKTTQVNYYFALPPTLIEPVCNNLHNSKLIFSDTKIIVEKPIGHNLKTAQIINDKLSSYFTDEQIYRIDHYLGKETVQNLIALRFANPILSTQWDSKSIEYVEITAAETVGIEDRWEYYDKVGQMRDMVQSHLLQLMCLVAMEPPSQLNTENIREAKEQVLKALLPVDGNSVIRAQYSDGNTDNGVIPGYLNEVDANICSDTETYVCIRAEISNWRWAGVPFYLQTGKRLAQKTTEIIIHFKADGHYIFAEEQQHLMGNKLVIRLDPKEGISLEVLSKTQGIKKGMHLRRDALQLSFIDSQKDRRIADAYERLLLDILKSEQKLFLSRNETELAWQWCDTIVQLWQQSALKLHTYPAGGHGPTEAKSKLQQQGHQWHEQG